MRHSLPLILLLTSSAPVFADDAPIRMDKIECQDLAGLAEDELSFLLAWLDGYFNHMHGTATLNDGSLAGLGKMIQEGCADSTPGPVMDMLNERIRLDALRQHP
ncbi:MAG: hypothetical protein HN793_03810 [Rhodospirillaceae bacterium]|nr:hypothetical protein [Rhodospirillaceae bacterium]MBT5564412.1 hypothetical protein [Rhodospirillaceae bacterium]MBT7449931.1 hypothetical protein [Rhodospirillaceae bacterium]